MKTLLQVTFNTLKRYHACQDRYSYLSKSLGGDEIYGLDTPINVLTILEHNGLGDAICALRATLQSSDKVCRLFSADCAESVLHIFEDEQLDDMRPRNAIQAARDFANGLISWSELKDAAWDAWDASNLMTTGADLAAWAAWAASDSVAADAASASWEASDESDAEESKQVQFLKNYLIADSAEYEV